ncbi:hypothetical protein [Inconstantimicrobium mannanitabidum]|uniref:Uncharacterized protein n=1 Tax=Inconstantimicrobium mannanitabidum TaxID=1604901 RepID=A0ACB5RHV8_9CLOT|nr:hypothetical protein [Clostridium sp. TW13]GKX68662.1 hypothetical protein rsdtw13_39200 [Clostridium sp. TW13]
MKDVNLKIAQQDIEDALQAVEDMEKVIDSSEVHNEVLKEKFMCLTEKVQKLENILKSEGIL